MRVRDSRGPTTFEHPIIPLPTSRKNNVTMAREFIPFAKPDIGNEEIEAVSAVLRSGWVTTGQKSLEFEKRFEELFGDGTIAMAVNSATAGLHLALEAIGIGPGDEVIVPSLTFTATAEVVRYLGGDPILVDVDANTLNIAPDRIRAAITPKTRAIIPVHYAGLPCDMTAILEILHSMVCALWKMPLTPFRPPIAAARSEH